MNHDVDIRFLLTAFAFVMAFLCGMGLWVASARAEKRIDKKRKARMSGGKGGLSQGYSQYGMGLQPDAVLEYQNQWQNRWMQQQNTLNLLGGAGMALGLQSIPQQPVEPPPVEVVPMSGPMDEIIENRPRKFRLSE